MAETTVYDNISVKLQFRTSLPTDDPHREERRLELSDMLKQLRDVIGKGLDTLEKDGWEVVVTEVAR